MPSGLITAYQPELIQLVSFPVEGDDDLLGLAALTGHRDGQDTITAAELIDLDVATDAGAVPEGHHQWCDLHAISAAISQRLDGGGVAVLQGGNQAVGPTHDLGIGAPVIALADRLPFGGSRITRSDMQRDQHCHHRDHHPRDRQNRPAPKPTPSGAGNRGLSRHSDVLHLDDPAGR